MFLGYQYSRWTPVEGYSLHAFFDRVDGLSTGSEVRISGVKVGSITDMQIDPQSYLAKVTFTIKKGHQLPIDSSAQIVGEGLMGPKYLALVPGGEDEMIPAGGKVKFTQSSVSLESLIGKMMFSKGDDKKAEPKKTEEPSSPMPTATNP